tara:strand:+ start:290 stop:784 length:495 start_codon:yes stop_codon:yes gene_type:complete
MKLLFENWRQYLNEADNNRGGYFETPYVQRRVKNLANLITYNPVGGNVAEVKRFFAIAMMMRNAQRRRDPSLSILDAVEEIYIPRANKKPGSYSAMALCAAHRNAGKDYTEEELWIQQVMDDCGGGPVAIDDPEEQMKNYIPPERDSSIADDETAIITKKRKGP